MRNVKNAVVHSQSKTAWNIIGEIPGMKYKIARLPYEAGISEITDTRNKAEALEHAIFISYCLNNAETITKEK